MTKKNKKGTNSINVYSYPDGNEIFSRSNFESLYNEPLKIRNDGIYAFQLGTNYTFDRTLGFKLVKTPANSNYKSSKVTRKRKYDLVTIQEPASQWVNSTSNENFKGGTSRIITPVFLPNNARQSCESATEWGRCLQQLKKP